jgi:dGTPase
LEYLINLVRDRIQTKNYNALTSKQDRISYLRALAIGTLIDEAAEIFMANENAILNGTFDTALLDASKYKAQIQDIITLSIKNVYNSQEVVQKEISGYEILNHLLQRYGTVAYNCFNNSLSHYDKLLIQLLPSSFHLGQESLYDNLLSVCRFVASLSDSNALMLHQKLKGQIY